MKNKEIEILKHMIEFYKKFCDGEEELNPIITGKEIKAIETILSYIEQLENNRDKAIGYNEHLIEHAKYHLNLGHLKKMRKILKGDNDE